MNQSIASLFFQQAENWSDRPFLHAVEETARIYGLEDRDYTYTQARERVDVLIENYRRIGSGQGVRVGVVLDNRPEFFLHLIALNQLGASVVPLNSGMQDSELEFLISHSEVGLIVAHPDYKPRFAGLVEKLGLPVKVIDPDELPQTDNLFELVTAQHNRDNEAAIIYTSGTTGKPKGCLLSNDYFLAIGELYCSIGGYCDFEPGEERLITPLPVTHMNALSTSFMGVLQSGGCLVQLDRFHPRSWWQSVRESDASIMHYLGVMPAMLLNAPVSDDDNLKGQVKFAFGAGCDPRHHANFEQRFGVPLVEAWAMSETGAGAWISASHEPRHVGTRCFGKAMPGLETKLVDEQGVEVATGEVGELLVRRSGDNPREHFFSGYLKNEAATEEAWAGGWFHSGDEVRQDDEGYFFFVDRRKNIIRRSGENIAAIEVESTLLKHPDVSNCAVCAVPDEIRGDEVAVLLMYSGTDSDEQAAREVFEFAMQALVYYKVPAYFVFVDRLPLTASEKVQRGEVKKLARARVASGDCIDLRAFKKNTPTAKKQ